MEVNVTESQLYDYFNSTKWVRFCREGADPDLPWIWVRQLQQLSNSHDADSAMNGKMISGLHTLPVTYSSRIRTSRLQLSCKVLTDHLGQSSPGDMVLCSLKRHIKKMNGTLLNQTQILHGPFRDSVKFK